MQKLNAAQQQVCHRLAETYRSGLFEDTLPFWLDVALDQQHDGYLTAVDRQGRLLDTDKSIWQQGRFCWLLASLYNQAEADPQWLAAAQLGARFLEQFGYDSQDGRMWFHVTREGLPIRKRRYAFSESFAAIAFGELARATGDEELKQRAVDAFDRFWRHVPAPKFTNTRPTRGLGKPMIALVTAQELRQSIGLESVEPIIDQCLHEIQQFHCRPDLEAVLETAGPQGEVLDHFEGRQLNPGHAIEAAWFVLREARIRRDRQLVQLGCQMLDWTWQRGWDSVYGGVLYFVDLDQKPVQEYWHDMKFWWPHNEAILATLMAWKLTGEARYFDWWQLAHEWAYENFPDPEGREWFGYLHRDGTVSTSLKGNLWKGPFHLPRMQWLAWQELEELSETDRLPTIHDWPDSPGSVTASP